MYKVRFTCFGGGWLCGDRARCWASHLSIFIQAPRPAPTESEIQSWREMKNVPEVNLEAKDNRIFENVNETFCLLWPLCDVLTWIMIRHKAFQIEVAEFEGMKQLDYERAKSELTLEEPHFKKEPERDWWSSSSTQTSAKVRDDDKDDDDDDDKDEDDDDEEINLPTVAARFMYEGRQQRTWSK